MTARKEAPEVTSNGYVDLEQLFKPRLPEDDVEVEGVGTVRVRALSRMEVLHIQAVEENETRSEEIERRTLAAGMVRPELTESGAGDWMKASPAGELEPVTDRIAELSGLRKDSAKEAFKEFHADPEAEFPVPAGE